MMDVLIGLLDNADSDDILHAIHSSMPADYYILLIDHTFSQDWMFISDDTYRRGKYHSFNDLPAVIRHNYIKIWFRNGKKHRDNDLPAIIWNNGTRHWYQYWYQHGQRHRDNDLPAVIYVSGKQVWYKHGIQYTQ